MSRSRRRSCCLAAGEGGLDTTTVMTLTIAPMGRRNVNGTHASGTRRDGGLPPLSGGCLSVFFFLCGLEDIPRTLVRMASHGGKRTGIPNGRHKQSRPLQRCAIVNTMEILSRHGSRYRLAKCVAFVPSVLDVDGRASPYSNLRPVVFPHPPIPVTSNPVFTQPPRTAPRNVGCSIGLVPKGGRKRRSTAPSK